MKRYVVMVLALTFLLSGLHTTFCQADMDARGNAAPDEALPEELKNLDVKDYFIASEAEPVGLIQTVTDGHVVVLHIETNDAYFAAQGDVIFQQDALFTLVDSRCRVKFITEDVITMGEDTRIDIEELIDDHELQKKKSTISMLRGKAMFYVLPLFRYKDVSTSVNTQTAVVGVRGTKFGVEVKKANANLAQSRPIYLADASDSSIWYLAQANPNNTETIVYCFEGEVDVYSPVDGTTQSVGEGENLQLTSIGAGDVQDTDPFVAEEFMSATEAQAPAADEDAGEGDEGASGQAGTTEGEAEDEVAGENGEDEVADEEGGDEVNTATTTGTGETTTGTTALSDNTTITQDQTTTSVDATEIRPTTHYGYFSAMLSDECNVYVDEAYVSSSRQDFDSSLVEADPGISDADSYMRFYPGAKLSGAYLEAVRIDVGALFGNDSLGSSYTISATEIGYNAYQEWGYWKAEWGTSQFIDINGFDHYVNNKAYYIFGDYTPDSARTGISGTYSGDAWGSYWNSTGGTFMTGTFNCNVDGSSGDVSGFTLNVSGDGKSAAISGGSGTFSGATSHFSLSGATYTLTPGGTGSGALSGSLYGPNGEYIGGAGAIYVDSDDSANVLFQGSK